jgi:two-component system sensor histidine kinase YesM
MKYFSLFAKLFLTSTLVSLFVFSGLTYTSLKSYKDAFHQQKAKDMSVFTERTGQYLDLYLLNIRNILITIVKNAESTPNIQNTKENLRYYADLNSSIVGNLYIVYKDGTVIANNQVVYSVIGHPHLKELFNNALENPELIYWSEPYYSPLLVKTTVAFTLCMRDDAGNIIGVAILEINTPKLNEQLSNLLYNTGQTYVLVTNKGKVVSFDPNSTIILHKPKIFPYEIRDEFVEQLLDLPNGVNRFKGAEGQLISVKSDGNQLGWYLISLTDEKDFNKSIENLYNRMIQIGLVWFLLMLGATMLISRNFTNPIKRLALQMDRIKDERMSTSIRIEKRNDEIEQLSTSFYTMLTRIKGLMDLQKQNEERKKRLELKLLISQIRPHFLYNTLACIGSLAKQNRIYEVEETIRALILLLTYSIDKKQEMIPLEEELKSLHAYVQIQKMRYSDSFEFITEIEEQHLGLIVPKLILQPLVENSIFHGFVEKENGRITIKSSVMNGQLSLIVKDDGVGISQEQILEISHSHLFEEDIGNTKSGLNGIGIRNVQERIKLNFGEEFGLYIRSEIGCGTEIELITPCLRNEP